MLAFFIYRSIIHVVAMKPKKPTVKTWQPTVEDQRLMDELAKVTGVTHPAILRMALRELAKAKDIPLEGQQ